MKTKSLLFILALAIIFSACSSRKKKEQTISLSGAFALYPMVIKWSDEYKKEHPDVRFNISAGGAGKGVADALSGTIDLGMLSRQIEQQEIDNGIWWVSVTKDAVIPTINSGNPLFETLKKRGLTRDEFRKIFITGEITNWNQLPGVGTDQVINVFTRSDACGAAATWAEYLGGKQEDLLGTGVFGDPGLADAVVKDINGVGYNNTIYLYDNETGNKNKGIEAIPIDINENGVVDAEEANYDKLGQILDAIAAGKFPSPPARDLYLVSKGKPQKQATLDFLKWVITKGQAFVQEAGYVPLNISTLDEQLSKLN
ncbi:MAG: phosphate transport system substrate-binding [Prolixibacteraceae bacterium]|nr:MAG: phosphate transport system substrate-binding [Prolixibacteraceae bacterium]